MGLDFLKHQSHNADLPAIFRSYLFAVLIDTIEKYFERSRLFEILKLLLLALIHQLQKPK